MPTQRRKYDPEFREGAVQIVRETGEANRRRGDPGSGGGVRNWARESLQAPGKRSSGTTDRAMTGSISNRETSTIRGEAHLARSSPEV